MELECGSSFTDLVMSGTESSAGNTLLHVSSQNGRKRVAKLLLRSGADLNAQNNNGPVLHFSFSYGFSDLGKYFISKGADDSILNKSGVLDLL
jgi:ankyrin repeat protein